jgi:predicted porin
LAANFDPFPISAAMGQGTHIWNGAGTGGNGASATSAASFSRRQNNLITYNMPTMNGFDASFAFSAANEAAGSTTSASTIQKPRMYSGMLSYTNGPLQVGAAYERHIDYNPGGVTAAVTSTTSRLAVTAVLGGAYTGGNDSMYTLGVGYTFMGSLRLSGIYNRIQYNNITTAAQNTGTDLSVNTYGVYADWAISGPHRVRLGYSVQGSTRGTFTGNSVGLYVGNAGAGQTGVQKLHGEYAYALSKRTELGLAYAKTNNDLNAAVSVGTGATTPNAGESQSFFGALIRHKF